MNTDPLAVLREDLEQPDIEIALEAIRHLDIIAKALGPRDTRNRLLPYLAIYAGVPDQEDAKSPSTPVDNVVSDEALTEIATQLGRFVGPVGGPGECGELLTLLEKLASAQETCIRKAAVESFGTVVRDLLNQNNPLNQLVEMAKRLSGHVLFSGRCSASGLIVKLYPNLPDRFVEQKASLRSCFVSLCKDDAPMVRKSSFECLGDMSVAVTEAVFKLEFLSCLKALQEETQENIRIFIVNTVISLTGEYKDDGFSELCQPLFEQALNENSWRIRRELANKFAALATNLVALGLGNRAGQALSKLLGDSQGEVRLAAIKTLGEVCRIMDSDELAGTLEPVLAHLANDPLIECRTALSKVVVPLCTSFGREVAAELLLPVINRIMESDIPELRENLMGDFNRLIDVLGPEYAIEAILPKVTGLAMDDKWRVRKYALENLAKLSGSIGTDRFSSEYMPIFYEAFCDHVYSVRDAAAGQMPILLINLGEDWLSQELFPRLMKMFEDNSNYLHRMVPIVIVNKIGAHPEAQLSSESMNGFMMPVLQAASRDPIANVRINCVRAGLTLLPKLNADVPEIQRIAMELAEDEDPDVRYYAAEILAQAG